MSERFFKELAGERKRMEAEGYEDKLVRSAMARLKLPKQVSVLARQIHEVTGTWNISMEAFNQAFSTFPITLGCNNLDVLKKPLHLNQKAVFPLWLKNFLELPFVKLYEEFYEGLGAIASEKPVGLVFPRHGFPVLGLLLHNGGMEYVPPKSACFYYKGVKTDLVVQPFGNFLDHVRSPDGIDWAPE